MILHDSIGVTSERPSLNPCKPCYKSWLNPAQPGHPPTRPDCGHLVPSHWRAARLHRAKSRGRTWDGRAAPCWHRPTQSSRHGGDLGAQVWSVVGSCWMWGFWRLNRWWMDGLVPSLEHGAISRCQGS